MRKLGRVVFTRRELEGTGIIERLCEGDIAWGFVERMQDKTIEM
jgi:hypothetical protein